VADDPTATAATQTRRERVYRLFTWLASAGLRRAPAPAERPPVPRPDGLCDTYGHVATMPDLFRCCVCGARMA
jgi:hypothetical protein